MTDVIDTLIEKDKQAYIDFARKNAEKDLYIYGAGRNAKSLLKMYHDNNIPVKGFCVSNQEVQNNKSDEMGIPIVPIDTLIGHDIAIALGVVVRLNTEISKNLNEKGFANYFLATEYLRYFGPQEYEFYRNPMIDITTKMGCAVNCTYCPQDVLLKAYFKTGNEKKVLDLNDYKKCIDKLPQEVLIQFAGFTEPFFNADCLDMIAYANEKRHKIKLFTTLLGLTMQGLSLLEKIQFEEFVLHVPDKEGYSHIPITDDYLRMLDRLRDMKKPDGKDFIDYACSQGSIPEVIREHLGSKLRYYVLLTDRAGNLDDPALYGQKNIKGCIHCEVSNRLNHNVLLPDGRVVLCSSDFGLKHVLGNLIESDYEEIMNGSILCELEKKRNTVDGDILCRNCCYAHTVEDKLSGHHIG